MPGLPVPHYPPDATLDALPGSPVRKHLEGRAHRPSLPPKVEDFLDKTKRGGSCGNVCTGPWDIAQWATGDVIHTHPNRGEHGEGSERYTQLILSGLAEALIDTIENATECERKPVWIAKRLFDTIVEFNEHWYKIDMLITMGGNSDNAMLIQMSMLKTVLAAIRFIARVEGREPCKEGRTNDPQLMVLATRLMARCLRVGGTTEYDRSIVAMGIFPDTWQILAKKARAEYSKGGPASRYISSRAFDRILTVPPEVDRDLLRWMFSPKVYSAIGGWMQTGTYLRGPDVAVKAPSWKAVRALLVVGHLDSLGLMDPDDANRKTTALAAKLLQCRVEMRDGSLKSIPKIEPPPAAEDPLRPFVERMKPTCAACTSSENLKRCTACKSAKYCSKECQISHRKFHKNKCKEREERLKFGREMLTAVDSMSRMGM